MLHCVPGGPKWLKTGPNKLGWVFIHTYLVVNPGENKNMPVKLSAFKREPRATMPKYYASAVQVLCKCFTSALQVLCKSHASGLKVSCKCYANSMQVLASTMYKL